MSSELSYRATTTGSTIYGTIRNASRQMWNTSGTPAFESLTVANWANYAIVLTETPSASYFYVGSWPSGITTGGTYTLDIYKQAGGSPAIGDTMIGTITAFWNGATFDFTAGNLNGFATFAVQADAGNTSSTFHANLPSTIDSFYVGMLMVFGSGTLQGQVRQVSAYNHTTGFVTVSSAFTGTPSAGDTAAVYNQ